MAIGNSINSLQQLSTTSNVNFNQVTSATTITATAGNISTGIGDILANSSTAGSSVNVGSIHSDNANAGSHAIVKSTSGGASGGDSIYFSTIAGVGTWAFGTDNSDSDAFVLSRSDTLGTSNAIHVDTSGRVNQPLQPCFSAYLNTSQLNATGDGTTYTIPFDTEIFDIGSNFNSTTGTFTAPVTGKYLLEAEVYTGDITAAMTQASLDITTTAHTYRMDDYKASTQAYCINKSIIADMTAGDTAIAQINIYGGVSKSADVVGKDNTAPFILTGFCGQLIS